MISATANLIGTITATAVIFSTQVGSCLPATAVIKDSAGTTIDTESIPSGATEDITITDSTVNVNKSNGVLISAVTVLAENTASYSVADSVAVLKNSANTTLLTENIRATETENIIAPNATAVLKNTLGTTLSTTNIPSGVSQDITAPNATVTFQNTDSDPIGLPLTAPSGASTPYTIANVAWTDSDGSAESTPYSDAIVCTPQVKSLFSKWTWEIGDDNTSIITVDADSAGTYTSETTDGASGTITYSKNGGAYAAFSNPTTYAIGDTIIVKRTITTALGWAKITGTYV